MIELLDRPEVQEEATVEFGSMIFVNGKAWSIIHEHGIEKMRVPIISGTIQEIADYMNTFWSEVNDTQDKLSVYKKYGVIVNK